MATENEGPRDGAERELSEKHERALEELAWLTGRNLDRFREQGLTYADMIRLTERTVQGLKQQGLSDADLIRLAGVTAEDVAMIMKLRERHGLAAPTVGKRHPYWRKGLAQGVHYSYMYGGHHIVYNWPDRGRLDTLKGRAKFALHPHVLRHTGARMPLAAGNDLVTVGRILGQSDVKTTARYCLPSEEDMRRAMARLGDEE